MNDMKRNRDFPFHRPISFYGLHTTLTSVKQKKNGKEEEEEEEEEEENWHQ